MSVPRVLIIDTYYPDFIKSLPFDPSSTYEVELRKVLDRSFGTADFYSRNLRAQGWDAVDIVANHEDLQRMWAKENGRHWTIWDGDILGAQIDSCSPDVVFMQDLSVPFSIVENPCLAGQLSCPWPGDEIVGRFDILYTSFPHYVPRIEALGVRAVYNPLAFEPSVMERTFTQRGVEGFYRGTWDAAGKPVRQRIHDVVFIGGVGNPSHWRYGMEVLETVAREIPTFKWWGYGLETLPADSALRRCYQGEAWGTAMYEILLQSKICLNRHGEVAEGYANNMRMFEATGCGAMLLTEAAPNLPELWPPGYAVPYHSPADAVYQIRRYLHYEPDRLKIAKFGEVQTLRDHTYAQRMKTVSETLLSMLCPA